MALVEEANPPYSTVARDTTSISVLETDVEIPWGDGRLCYGSVEVTNQVVSFLRRRVITGEVLGETKLDLPPRTLRTRAVWWTVTEDQLDAARINPEILGGALHAAEHASIGMLPLFATCDRWDIGGVSVPLHPDTLLPTVFVYDGHPGGAGFAERAFHTARAWLTATRQAIASCECDAGCPSCIQSPKCGNGNEPLHKRGAVRLLTVLLRGAPEEKAPDGQGLSLGHALRGRLRRPQRPGAWSPEAVARSAGPALALTSAANRPRPAVTVRSDDLAHQCAPTQAGSPWARATRSARAQAAGAPSVQWSAAASAARSAPARPPDAGPRRPAPGRAQRRTPRTGTAIAPTLQTVAEPRSRVLGRRGRPAALASTDEAPAGPRRLTRPPPPSPPPTPRLRAPHRRSGHRAPAAAPRPARARGRPPG